MIALTETRTGLPLTCTVVGINPPVPATISVLPDLEGRGLFSRGRRITSSFLVASTDMWVGSYGLRVQLRTLVKKMDGRASATKKRAREHCNNARRHSR